MKVILNKEYYRNSMTSNRIDNENDLQPFNIYFNLKEYYTKDLSRSELSNMYIHHLKCERCLSMLRLGNIKGSIVLYREIANLDFNFPSCIQHGMDSFFFAMAAYYDFIVHENFEDALKKLKLGMESVITQAKDFPFFILEFSTQWINIIRIFIKEKKKDAIIQEFSCLLQLVMYGMHTNKIAENSFKELDIKERDFCVNDVFNNVIYSLEKRFEHEEVLEIINEVFCLVVRQMPIDKLQYSSYNSSINKLFAVLSAHLENDYEKYFNNFKYFTTSKFYLPVALHEINIQILSFSLGLVSKDFVKPTT